MKKALDPWNSSARTQSEQATFKESLISVYDRGCQNSGCLRCMVLDVELPRGRVIAAHLWKRSTHGDGLEYLALKKTDVHSTRNGLLLYDPIEKAFDRKELCFLYNSLTQRIVCKVLNPALQDVVCREWVLKRIFCELAWQNGHQSIFS